MAVYIGITSGSEELKHYGRLGMKWYQHIFGDDPRWGSSGRGKRKGYVDKLGITPKGQALLDGLRSDAEKKFKDEERNRSERVKSFGIQMNIGSDFDVIKRGAVVRRVTDNPSESMDRRKYVSITNGDSEQYKTMWDMLGLDPTKKRYEVSYKITKSMKVANYEAIINAANERLKDVTISMLSDNALKQLLSESKSMGKFVKKYKDTKLGILSDEWKLQDFLKDSKKIPKDLREYINDSCLVKHKMRDALLMGTIKGADLYEDLAKQGYDAAVDPVDYSWIADYPVIVLNPRTSMRAIGLEDLTYWR